MPTVLDRPRTRLSSAEVNERGHQWFETRIRPLLRPEDTGKHLVVNVETGAYAIDADDLAATDRLLEADPDAQLCGIPLDHPILIRTPRAEGRL